MGSSIWGAYPPLPVPLVQLLQPVPWPCLGHAVQEMPHPGPACVRRWTAPTGSPAPGRGFPAVEWNEGREGGCGLEGWRPAGPWAPRRHPGYLGRAGRGLGAWLIWVPHSPRPHLHPGPEQWAVARPWGRGNLELGSLGTLGVHLSGPLEASPTHADLWDSAAQWASAEGSAWLALCVKLPSWAPPALAGQTGSRLCGAPRSPQGAAPLAVPGSCAEVDTVGAALGSRSCPAWTSYRPGGGQRPWEEGGTCRPGAGHPDWPRLAASSPGHLDLPPLPL